jgi:tetratricopeptide (TPR) repeat protein
LLAVDLEMSRHKDRQEEIERQTIERWKNASNDEVTALAAWLAGRREYQRELDVVPLDRAIRTRELFVQHIEALEALNRWEDVRQILESERFPLDPVTQSMFLARCYAREGQQKGAENNWERALESAAGSLRNLLTVGDYAEKSGAYTVAASAYDAAAATSPKSRLAQQGRLRVAYAIQDTKRIHALLEGVLKIWPKDTALQNDEAYVTLLLWPNESAAEKRTSISSNPSTPGELNRIEMVAENLVKQDPTSIPHRSLLALLRLRQNRPADALAVYAHFAASRGSITPASVAVHAATLAANGRVDQARAEIANILRSDLLPEERDLVKRVASD